MRRRETSRRTTPRTVFRDRPPVAPFPAFYRPPVRPLVVLEDRRQFHPLGLFAPPAVFSNRSARKLVERPSKARPGRPLSYVDPFPALRLGFAVPEKVVRCVRRKQRRAVMFANRKTGAGSQARRKRNIWSSVSC